jgi:PKD domain/Secretion system C-terminal sorting domain
MNTNEEMIFDELMRQKLGDYSELPDMAMMNKIHAKKNRIITLYKLTKVFSVLCLIGLSVFGVYMLLKPNEINYSQITQNNSQTVSTISQNTKAASTGFNNPSIKQSLTNNKNLNPNLVAPSTIKSFPTQVTAHAFSTTSETNQKNIESKSLQKNSPPNINSINTNPILNPAKKDSVITKQGEQNSKSKDISKNCKAAFDYYVSYDGKYNFTNFSETEVSANLLWDFGDGTSSTINSPNHIFKNSGNYTVTLKVNDITNSCSDILKKNIVFNSELKHRIQNISIKGKVVGGIDDVKNGNVTLMLFNPDKNSFTLFARTAISLSGEYSFADLKTGTYLILADANSPKYIPTYWGNTTDLSEAVEIHIMENDVDDLIGLNISLANTVPFNNGDISHNYSKDSNGYVMVIDQNNNVIGKAKIDANGNANLSEFPAGNYTLLNPKTGNINPITIAPGGALTGDGSLGSENGKITLIPNPAISDVKFSIDITQENEVAEIMIMNASGSMVYHKNQICIIGTNPFNIDVSNLPSGEYYVVINVGGNQTLSGRMIKTGNNSSNNR